MLTCILIASSIFAVFTIIALFRRRLARCVPKPIKVAILLTSLVVVAVVSLVFEVLCLVCLAAAKGQHRLLGMVLTATTAVCIGCSKPADPSKPNPIQWSAADGNYHSETTAPDKGAPKKEP